MLEDLGKEVYVTMGKEFLYRRDKKGMLVTRVRRLADPEHGSAIKSFRAKEEEKCKLPLVFWS